MLLQNPCCLFIYSERKTRKRFDPNSSQSLLSEKITLFLKIKRKSHLQQAKQVRVQNLVLYCGFLLELFFLVIRASSEDAYTQIQELHKRL